MKFFFFKVFLFTIPFAMIMMINLIIDNSSIFTSDETYEKYGKYIAEGKNISNLYNYNEFLTKKFAIKHMEKSPEIVCFGSSRVMQINSTIFRGKSFFNMGVSAITLKEVIASYNVIYERGFRPETIIIGIDPSFFLKDRNTLREYFQNDYNSYVYEYNLDNYMNIEYSRNKYIELISPIYCFENIKYGSKDISIVDSVFIDEPVLNYDGSYIYNINKRNQLDEDILQEAKRQYSSFFYDRFNKKEIDLKLLKLFENFIKTINDNNNKIIFFFPPFHTYISDELKKNKDLKVVNEIELVIKNFANEQSIETIGNFKSSINEYFLQSTDFYDGVHPNRAVVEKIFRIVD